MLVGLNSGVRSKYVVTLHYLIWNRDGQLVPSFNAARDSVLKSLILFLQVLHLQKVFNVNTGKNTEKKRA